jgi:hypothetical protein
VGTLGYQKYISACYILTRQLNNLSPGSTGEEVKISWKHYLKINKCSFPNAVDLANIKSMVGYPTFILNDMAIF